MWKHIKFGFSCLGALLGVITFMASIAGIVSLILYSGWFGLLFIPWFFIVTMMSSWVNEKIL